MGVASVEGRREMSQHRIAADLVMATQTWLGGRWVDPCLS